MRKQQKKKLKNRISDIYYAAIRKPIYRLKSFIECNIIEKTVNAFNRAVKGYSFRDVWDFENWFVHIIPRMIEEVKNRKIFVCCQYNSWAQLKYLLNGIKRYINLMKY